MNATLVFAFLRQRFSSPMRLGLLTLVTLFPLGGVALMGSLSALGSVAGAIALIIAAGGVGQDVSSGTLQLLLVRPVTRTSYFASRWLASSLAAILLTFVLVALGSLALVLRHSPPAAGEILRVALESIAAATGNAAVVLMLSTLAGGLGDIAIYFATLISAQLLGGAAALKGWTALARVAAEIQGTLSPQVSFAWLGLQGTVPWFALASWASTITLALAIGIARLNRRELSYAAG